MSTFLYFAYGSNMSERRLRDRVSSAKVIGTGVLQNYCLTFNKCSSDGSGKCTIEPCKSGRVYGVLFEIKKKQEKCLDKVEGLCKGYKDRKVSIKIRNYKQPETYECRTKLCDVKTYQATNPCQNLKPYFWYKQHVLVGAIEQNLPPWYIRRLIQVPAKEDPCPKRVMCQLAIYS